MRKQFFASLFGVSGILAKPDRRCLQVYRHGMPTTKLRQKEETMRPVLMQILWVCAMCAAACAAPAVAANDVPAKHCTYVRMGALPVDVQGQRLIVTGSINREAVRMLLDTGAEMTSLSRRVSRSLNLGQVGPSFEAYGLGGAARSYFVEVSEMAIGDVRGEHLAFPMIWDADLTEAEVLLGADYLFQNDLELSLADRRLAFFHPVGCKDEFLAYWDREASVAALEPIDAEHPVPRVKIEINGHEVVAEIDTGAPTSILDLGAARRIGLDVEGPGALSVADLRGIGRKTRRRWIVPIKKIVVGDEEIQDGGIEIGDFVEPTRRETHGKTVLPDMLLGLDFLQAYRVLFAVSQRRLYLSYLGGELFYPLVLVNRPM
jgi:predicted aspartyl protease